jgi:hypothetical protein
MKREKTIAVVIVEPYKPARVEMIENTLEAKQKIVGGRIECIRLDGYDIIINEEGKLEALEPNFGIHNGMDYVAGTAIFAGVNYDEGDFISLTPEQRKFIVRQFQGRELIFND